MIGHRPLIAVFTTLMWMTTLLVSPAASANDDTKKGQARALFDEGQTLYAAGDYEPARKKFESAYELFPLKAFLFNIGQCHFQLERYDDAAWFYKEYLKDNANAPNADIVQEYIIQAETRAEASRQKAEAEKAQKRAEQAAEERKVAEKATAAAEAEAKRAELERRLAEKRAADAERRRAEAIEGEDALSNQWWFYPAIGGGIVVGALIVASIIAGGTGGVIWGIIDANTSQGTLGSVDTRGGAE